MDYATIKAWPFEPVTTRYDAKDASLYALAIGHAADPLDQDDLRFVLEDRLVPSPAIVTTLGHPGPWMRDARAGIDYAKVLHAEQSVTWHAPLPPAATVEARTEVIAVVDKGERTGALVVQRRRLLDRSSGGLLATVEQTNLCRGDGGLDRSDEATPALEPVPDRTPDDVLDLPTLPQAALLYRLCGDMNPLHADPEAASRAGFERPIAHGLLTFGLAVRGLVGRFADGDPARLGSVRCRFTAPLYPGETVRLEVWRQPERKAAFRARAMERDVVVLDRGHASA